MVFAAFMAGSGCIKDKEKDFAEDQVSFSANTGALETRTEYGASGQNNTVQYVDWVDGDRITILMSTGSSDNYTIAREYTGSDSDGISKASLTAQSSGLSWGSGTGDRTFYAMYPAAGTEGSTLTSSAMTAVIPATWKPNDDDLVRLPLGYMYATLTTPRTRTVSLTFNPKFTAFCFTLKNPTGSPVTLSSLSLSSASKAMSGTFTVNPSTGAIKSLPTPGDNKSVTVDFTLLTDGGLVIPAGSQASPGTKTFTIVTVPDTFNDLTVTCTKSGGASRTLGLKKAGTYLSFDALKKHNISITLPSFADFEYGLSVIDPTDLTYNGNSSTNGTVTSYKSNDGGTTQTSVPWFVEGYYATEADAEAGTNKLASYSTSGLLSAAIANVTSPTSVTTSVPISYNPAVGKTLGDYIDDNIKNSTFGAKSSPSRYINLANAWNLVSDTESDAIIQSANCYIVNGPGYYRIPLIMGNGVNSSSSEFVNYKGSTISSDAYLKNQGGTPTTVKVIWEDVEGLIDGATSSNEWVVPSAINGDWLQFHIDKEHIKQGNAVIAVYDDSSTPLVMWSYHIWVTDYVPANYAYVMEKSSGDISLTNTNPTPKSYKASPYNLGWVVTGSASEDYYLSASVYVRVQQGTPGNEVGQHCVMSVSRPAHGTPSSSDLKTGRCAYYQFGRKDPLQGDYTTYGVFSGISQATASGVQISSSLTAYTTVGQVVGGIRSPGKVVSNFLGSTTSNNAYPGNSNNFVHRLWDASHSYSNPLPIDEDVTKTMYDPCPVGYNVPSYHSFHGVSLSTFPACGYRNGQSMENTTYYWYATANSSAYSVSYKLNDNTSYNYSSRASAMPIRPVQDPTFDPTNDGTLSGSGPSINWQN